MAHTKSAGTITWADVGHLLSQMERTFYCEATVWFGTLPSTPRDGCLTIVVTFKPATAHKGTRRPVSAQGHYPSRRYRSMAGAVVGLAYEASERAQSKWDELAAATQRPLPLD